MRRVEISKTFFGHVLKRRESRASNKTYHRTLGDLKKSHKRLFDPKGNKVVTQRKIGYNSNLTLVEGNLRLLIKDTEIKKKNLAFFLELLHRYSDSGKEGSEIKVRETRQLS